MLALSGIFAVFFGLGLFGVVAGDPFCFWGGSLGSGLAILGVAFRIAYLPRRGRRLP